MKIDLNLKDIWNYLKNVSPVEYGLMLLNLVLIIALVACILMVLFALMFNLLAFFEKQKKTYKLTISYDKLEDFDQSYKIKMLEFFKSLRSYIKSSVVSIEFLKKDGKIYTNIYCNDKRTIESINDHLQTLTGVYSKIDSNFDIKNDSKTNYQVNTISSRFSHYPFAFSQSNSLSKVFETLENITEGGVQITLRATKKHWFYSNEIKGLRKSQASKDNNSKEVSKNRLVQLEDKIKFGDLFIAKMFTFAKTDKDLQSVSNSTVQTIANRQMWIAKCSLFPNYQLNSKYIARDTAWFRTIPRKYNLMNSIELAQFFYPTFSYQQFEVSPNVVELSTDTSKNIAYTLNNEGDSISYELGTLNKICFGDPNSGKSSAFLSTELLACFNSSTSKKFGLISTVFKQDEADLVIHLAKENNRLDDLLVISRNEEVLSKVQNIDGANNTIKRKLNKTKWVTNIGQSILEDTLSVDNLIDLFNSINKIKNNEADSKAEDPFWTLSNYEFQRNLIRLLLLVDDKFSISRLVELGSLAISHADSIRSTQIGIFPFLDLLDRAKTKLELPEVIVLKKQLDRQQIEDFTKLFEYFNQAIVQVPENTLKSVFAVFKSTVGTCNQGIIKEKLFTDQKSDSNGYFTFDQTRQGKIIVLDLPVETGGVDVRIFQVISKIAWQQSMLRTGGDDVYFVSDEFSNFTSSNDGAFYRANRSYGVHNILATQNITGIVMSIGKLATEELLNNCQTKYFFNTQATSTIDYALKVIGDDKSINNSKSLSGNMTDSTMETMGKQLLTRHFRTLSQNLPKSQAECIIVGSQTFKKNKLNYLNLIFNKIDRFKTHDLTVIAPDQFANDVFNIKIRIEETSKITKVYDRKTIDTETTKTPLKEALETKEVKTILMSETKEFMVTNKEIMDKYKVAQSSISRKVKEGVLTPIKIKDGKIIVNHYNLSEVQKAFELEKVQELTN
jgi:TraM recognition site of TraD and TraG